MGYLLPPPPILINRSWSCEYCSRENPVSRLTCLGCQAPKPKRIAQVREVTYKGVPISRLTDEERDEALEAAKSRFRNMYIGPRSMSEILRSIWNMK